MPRHPLSDFRPAVRSALPWVLLVRFLNNTGNRFPYSFLGPLALGTGFSVEGVGALLALRDLSGLSAPLIGKIADSRGTERLMRTLTCPLLVVNSPEHKFVNAADQKIRIKKILVGCDFSPDSGQALNHALSLAQEFQAELHLAHVVEPPTQPGSYKEDTPVSEEIQQDYRDLLTRKLKEMVPAEARLWCTPQTGLLEGRPYEEIVAYAGSKNIDMIVLGVRGHGLVKTL